MSSAESGFIHGASLASLTMAAQMLTMGARPLSVGIAFVATVAWSAVILSWSSSRKTEATR